MLRRSLGVSETAPTDSTVKPAPPVDGEISESFPEDVFGMPSEFSEPQFKLEMEEIDAEGNVVHDEL